MFISKINFNQQKNEILNLKSYQTVNFRGVNSNTVKNVIKTAGEKEAGIIKKILMSVSAFVFTYKLSKANLKDAIENGELDMQGKKINTEGEKTQNYLRKREEYKQTHLPKSVFGEIVGINIHSVDWHILKGNIEQNEDGTIDPTTEKNKYFLENFEKGATKKIYEYTPQNYPKLQKRLGAIKIEHCLEKGLLVAEPDGSINTQNPVNKDFIEMVESKEISIRDFYLSKRDFAKFVGQSELTIFKAIKEGKIVAEPRIGIDVSHPINKVYINDVKAQKEVGNPRKYKKPEGYVSRQELANLLDITIATLCYHIQVGHIVANRQGIDLNNPINIHFVENFRKGVKKEMPDGVEKVPVKYDGNYRKTKSNYLSQTEFAKKMGMTQPTVEHHIVAGHIIYTKDGIDLEHPQNIHFMNNYKRGEKYVMPNGKVVEVPEKDLYTQTDYNHLTLYEVADMLCVTNTPIIYHRTKGRLEVSSNKKFDLGKSINKNFIESYESNVIDAYSKMNTDGLNSGVNKLKKLLQKRVSENVYTVVSKFSGEQEELSSYLKYSLSKIVDLNLMTSEQVELLEVIFEEMINEVLNSDKERKPVYYQSENKLDIMLYKNLLNEIIKREQATVETVNVAYPNELDEGMLNISKELKNVLEKAEKEFEREIQIYKNVSSKRIEDLQDAYLQYRFEKASKDYFNLKNFNDSVSKNNLEIEDDDKKIKFIVERVLMKVGTSDFTLSKNYKRWRYEYKPRKNDIAVASVIDRYGKLLLAKICTPVALEMLQKANPAKEITMQDLECLVCEKFDL